MTLLRAQREALFTIHSQAHAIEAFNDGAPSRMPTRQETEAIVSEWDRLASRVDEDWHGHLNSVRNAVLFLQCVKQAELRLSAAMTVFQGNV